MKLNYKRTFCVGAAFFLICTFWQAYDTLIPKILTDKFGMSQTLSGIIMSLDNVLALFLLPLFGAFSDKNKSKRGKRTPYIIVGTILSAVLFVTLSFADYMQYNKLENIASNDQAALSVIYESEKDTVLKTPDGVEFILSEQPSGNITTISKAEFTAISTELVNQSGDKVSNPYYTDYVVPARQNYAWNMTVRSPLPLILFAGLLLLVLLSMASFRSPAVALMPDVTPKPLRSKANAVINLMGAIGGILVLGLGIVFGTGKAHNALMSYTPFFVCIAVIMLVSLAFFMLTVREPKFTREAELIDQSLNDNGNDTPSNQNNRLSKGEKISLALILASVIFWFMGYNAVISKYSVYAGKVLNLDYNLTLMIANAAAIVSYLPIGIISSKIGRKKTLLIGIAILGTSFAAASFMRSGNSVLLMNILFILAGIGWAAISVNSYPMVVELAKGSNVGKYTGFYYTASMAAQTVTPIISGFLMDIKFTVLFPYAAVFVALSFITTLFVRHGDSRPEKQKFHEVIGD